MTARSSVDALDAADAEEALLACLEDRGVDGAWRYADALAAAGVDNAWVERVVEAAGPGGGCRRCAGSPRRSRPSPSPRTSRSPPVACPTSSAP